MIRPIPITRAISFIGILLFSYNALCLELNKDSLRNEIVEVFYSGKKDSSTLGKLNKILKTCKSSGFQEEEGMTLSVISNYYSSNGAYDSAILYVKKSLGVRKSIGKKGSIARTYYLLAQDMYNKGYEDYSYFDSALLYLNKSNELLTDIQDDELKIANQLLLSSIYNNSGSSQKAIELLSSSNILSTGNGLQHTSYYYELAVGNNRLKKFEEALENIDSAKTYMDSNNTSLLKYKIYILESMVYRDLGEFNKAKNSIELAKIAYKEFGPEPNKTILFLNKARFQIIDGTILLSQGKIVQAVNKLKDGINYLDSSNIKSFLFVSAYENLAEAYAQLGDLEKGMEAYKKASEWKGKNL